MAIMVLGENAVPSGPRYYRGTYRQLPSYWESLSSEHEYNRLFHWYAREGGESLVVHDLGRARRLVECLRELGRNAFEVVRVGGSERNVPEGQFLGFDLTAGFRYSPLAGGMSWTARLKTGDRPPAIYDLVNLIEVHFGPLLNEHGLFSDRDVAELCLRSMVALQSFSPDLWECQATFERLQVLALWSLL